MTKKALSVLLLFILLAGTAYCSLTLFFSQRNEHDRMDVNEFPLTIGGWRGRDLDVQDNVYKILETENVLSREYVNDEGDTITLLIVYSETNRSVFHPPEVCLMGGGIEITDKEVIALPYKGNDITVNKLYLAKDSFHMLALYCYKAGKLNTANFYLQQLYFSLGQLSRKPVKGATIRVSMPLGPGEEENAYIRLREFLLKVLAELDEM